MDIYIDNEKTKFGRRTKDFEKILRAISKKLEKNEKIIKSIYINGNILEDDTIIDLTRQNIIEVETKSYTDLTLEALNNSKEYIATFFEVKDYLNQKIENNEKIIDFDIEETDNFLAWFIDVIHLLLDTYVFALMELPEMYLILVDEVKNLSELRQKEDFVAYMNALDYSISDILENFDSNIDYYCKCILEEEEKKQIIL